MAGEETTIEQKIKTLEDLSAYLFDLANTVHEHRDMLFRLSDEAKEEADKLRQQATGKKASRGV